MLRLLVALLPTLRSAVRSRRNLVFENLALRQQLATLASRRHPEVRPADRAFWILLRLSWSQWAEALAIVRPDTVVRWHRAGFRIYWNWLSRRGRRSGRPPLPREVRALIRRMATENSWGAPRIHGELLCLGFEISERSVTRYLRTLPRAPRTGQTWTTFLRNHRDGIAANKHHLRRLLDSFIDHYKQDRTRLGLGKDSPLGRPVEHRPAGSTSNVVSLPRVGGLHHRYAWSKAA